MKLSDETPLSMVLGLPFHRQTMAEALEDSVAAMRDRGSSAYFVTANLDITRQAYLDSRLREIIFRADRVYCDGLPLVWLSRLFGVPLPERVAGSDMTPLLLERCARENLPVYFFGSDNQTLKRAAAVLKHRYTGLRVVGCSAPPVGEIESWSNEAIVNQIRCARPALLLVALGCPKQEYWISQYLEKTGVPLAIGIGASLDFVAGKQVRAPRWIQALGMEWLWRFSRDPRRLGHRYASDLWYLLTKAPRQWRFENRFISQAYTVFRRTLAEDRAWNTKSLTPAIRHAFVSFHTDELMRLHPGPPQESVSEASEDLVGIS